MACGKCKKCDAYSDEQKEVAIKMMGCSNPEEAFSDMCPKDGCVKQVGSDWRVISNKTGKLWPAKYKSEKDAKAAIAAYHVAKNK